jgi:putative glutamine amidotransferase
VEISLFLPTGERSTLAETLDGIVLSGSPADIEPQRFGAARHDKTAARDKLREETDDFFLDHAFAARKPLLAICFGIQSLNTHLGGSLFQDIPSELGDEIDHSGRGGEDAYHDVRIEGGRLAPWTEQSSVRVNSSHHQSISKPGNGLQVTARAADGVIEAVEWTGRTEWVMGVQWHPERMQGDPLADRIFRELVSEAQGWAAGH